MLSLNWSLASFVFVSSLFIQSKTYICPDCSHLVLLLNEFLKLEKTNKQKKQTSLLFGTKNSPG